MKRKPYESASSTSNSTPSDIGPNPYKGLMAFHETDGDRFFGREQQIAALWEKLRSLHETETTIRVLPIYGPSGSGKSSLARAGLIPELARHPLPGYDRAQVAVLVPGTHPVGALATVLAQIATQDPIPVEKAEEFERVLKKLSDQGAHEGLRRIADSLFNVAGSPLIILVDQFEEVYTLCDDPAEQDAFIKNLLNAASERTRRVSVILTLRSDFLGETQKHPQLNRLFAKQGVLVSAMSENELRQAIHKPAELAGHPLDEATVSLLVEQTEGREGALPLLQFALTQIWQGLIEGTAPVVTLERIGGIGGALAGEAQRVYDSLTPAEQAIARRVFMGLVQLGEGTRDTRRRVTVENLVSYRDDLSQVKQVIGRFTAPGVRLMTLSADSKGVETAEVTHEALFDQWRLLKQWLAQSRDDLRFQRRLEAAAQHWNQNHRPEGNLWRSPDLELLQQYYRRAGNNMTPLQIEFFKASQQAEQQRKKRRQLVITGLISGLVLATTTSFIALYQLHRAEKLRMGLYETLAEQSVASEPLRSLQHGVLAVTLGRSRFARFPNWSLPTLVPDELIEESLSKILPQRVLQGHLDHVLAVAFSPNGQRIATGDRTGRIRLWTSQGEHLISFQASEKFEITSLTFSADSQTVITGAVDGAIKTWNLKGDSISPSWTAPSPGRFTIALLPTGQIMQLGQGGSRLEFWHVQNKAVFPVLERFAVVALSPHQNRFFMVGGNTTGVIRVLDAQGKLLAPPVSAHQGQVREIAVFQSKNRDESYIATAGYDKKLRLWRLQSSRLLPLSNPISLASSISALAFTSYQSQPILISGDDSGGITLWDLQGNQIREPLKTHEGSTTAIAVSPDGKSVITGGQDNVGRLWQLDELPLWFPRRARQSGITSAAVAQDVPLIVTGGQNGTIRIWNQQGIPLTNGLPAHPKGTTLVAISTDGKTIISAGQDGKIQRWQGRDRWGKQSLGNHDTAVNAIALTLDGKTLVSGDDEGNVWLWQLDKESSRQRLSKFNDGVRAVFIAPDGSKILALGVDGTLHWWSASNLQAEHSFPTEEGPLLNGSVVLSPSGQQIATGADAGQIKIWSLNGQLIQTITNDDHQGSPITSLAFSPDGKRILSGGWNAKTYLWNLEGNAVGQPFEGHGNKDESAEVNAVAFLPDGQTVISVGSDDTLRFWPTDWQGWLPIACQQLHEIILPTGFYRNTVGEPRRACKNFIQRN